MPNTPPHSDRSITQLDEAYARLRRIAQKLMTRERPNHTLSPTDVVNEAVSKLLSAGWTPPAGGADPGGQEFVKFVSHAARAMTEVLIDYSRRHGAAKRGGARVRLDDLDDFEATVDRDEFDWGAMDRAMSKLQATDPRRHSVVTLRFVAGMDNRQIAQQLGVDERTVSRDWSAARLWLRDALKQEME